MEELEKIVNVLLLVELILLGAKIGHEPDYESNPIRVGNNAGEDITKLFDALKIGYQ